jgi:hypothetical protein
MKSNKVLATALVKGYPMAVQEDHKLRPMSSKITEREQYFVRCLYWEAPHTKRTTASGNS